jgi:hypothetical protein
MPHELTRRFGLVTTSLRYQCDCTNNEIITINVVYTKEDWENEERFLDIVRAARRDMITEIKQHIKGATA